MKRYLVWQSCEDFEVPIICTECLVLSLFPSQLYPGTWLAPSHLTLKTSVEVEVSNIFWSKPKVTGGLGRRRSRAVLGELEGRWVALLLSILGGVRVRVTWYMSALVDIFWIFRYFRNKESLKKKVGYVFHIALLHFHLHCIGKHSSNIYFCKIAKLVSGWLLRLSPVGSPTVQVFNCRGIYSLSDNTITNALCVKP